VAAFDLSGGYLAEARARAQANQVAVACVQADGEKLPFADQTFERIWGNAVLHHLDIEPAARELRRVLWPGGWAVFCEPWGGNPLLRWARQHLPYRGKERTPDEVPLGPGQVQALEKFFHVQVEYHQLLGMAGRVLPAARSLAWCDRRLLTWLPGLQRWCRYVVLRLSGPDATGRSEA
jgi:SAM-dependent methyltransferase